MELKMTTRKALEIHAVMENSDKVNLEFSGFEITEALVHNKNQLNPIVESFKMLNKQSVDFKKYQRAIETAKNSFASNPDKLKEELDKIDASNIDVREKEFDRIDAINEQLEKEVVVKNITPIDRKTATGELTIRGKGSIELKYIMTIQPFFKENAVTAEQTAKPKK
jgi:cell fate (sporulation/competence/biofilm development) regulator YmcA (YheA/YmcA/DUF963 family)